MRFYRVHEASERNNSAGYLFFTRRDEADRCVASMKRMGQDETTLEEIDVTPNKAGILGALNQWASHPDNG